MNWIGGIITVCAYFTGLAMGYLWHKWYGKDKEKK